eukprot:scaffold121619_cov63-Phaeocystis_antarctica.AAC.1
MAFASPDAAASCSGVLSNCAYAPRSAPSITGHDLSAAILSAQALERIGSSAVPARARRRGACT